MKAKTSANRREEAGKRGVKRAGARKVPIPPEAVAPEMPKIEPRWRWHYRTLVELRSRLLRESQEKRREVAETIEAHSMHAADSATDEFEHDVALSLLAREENALRDVNDAIARIVAGRYGVCELTQVVIDARRLRALPWCRYSREAEEQLERRNGGAKWRLPGVVSVRGPKNSLPGTGTITREDSEGPAEEPHERDAAKKVVDPSTPDFDASESEEAALKTEPPVSAKP